MAGALRHLLNRDGRYYARLVVPADLREAIAKRELRTALGPDRRAALRRLPLAVAGLLDQLAQARRAANSGRMPSRPLSILEIAHIHYEEELTLDERARNFKLSPLPEKDETDEYGQRPYDLPEAKITDMNRLFGPGREQALRRVASGESSDDEIEALVGWAIEQLRGRGATAVQEGSPFWRALARMLASVELEALHRSFERDAGDFAGKPRFPLLTEPRPHFEQGDAVPLGDLFQGYIRELKRSGRGAEAERRWTPCFAALKTFLKHDDAGRLTRNDVVRWRQTLLETLAPKTVRDVYLGSLKAVLAWAVDGDQLPSNVAAPVKVRVPRRVQSREQGFTDAEAAALLRAARAYTPPPSANPRTRESASMTAAKRWIPWLCAFTGARVAEIAQLRKKDVLTENGTTYIRITPDAGSVKTGQFRDVPLHAQLIELGFLALVDAAVEGPLFFDARTRRTGAQHASKTVTQRLAKWIRSLKIVPAGVDPNHAWRHRLKTKARDLGIDSRVVDAIQGHAARTAGDAYGEVSLRAMKSAMDRLPAIDLGPAIHTPRNPHSALATPSRKVAGTS